MTYEPDPKVGDRVRVTYTGEVVATIVPDVVRVRRDGAEHWIVVPADTCTVIEAAPIEGGIYRTDTGSILVRVGDGWRDLDVHARTIGWRVAPGYSLHPDDYAARPLTLVGAFNEVES